MGIMEIGMITILVVCFFIGVSVFTSLYQKCGPNEAMIISGYGWPSQKSS